MKIAEPADAMHIAELEAELFPENCMNEWTIQNEITADGSVSRVLYIGELLIGYIIGRTRDGITDVLRLGVREGYQSLGFGKKLLDAVEGSTILTVQKDNGHALRFYFKSGFKIVAKTPHGNSWVMDRS